MKEIVTCQCGAKVRLPRVSEGRSFRCPKCKNGIALTVDAKILSSSQLGGRLEGTECPICQSGIGGDEMVVTCPECGQVHHRECWSEVGGCGTYGCREAPSVGKKEPEHALSAWGDTKNCPACGESIKAIALRCRYCGTDFDTVDPLSVSDLRRQVTKGESAQALQKTSVVLFVLSILGCLAPLIAVVGAAVLLPRRAELARGSPVYLVLGYSAIGLSVLYSVLMLVFLFV